MGLRGSRRRSDTWIEASRGFQCCLPFVSCWPPPFGPEFPREQNEEVGYDVSKIPIMYVLRNHYELDPDSYFLFACLFDKGLRWLILSSSSLCSW